MARSFTKRMDAMPEWVLYVLFVALFLLWLVLMEIDIARGIWPPPLKKKVGLL